MEDKCQGQQVAYEEPDGAAEFRKVLDDVKGGKLYIGSKIIRATPMSECEFLSTVKGQDVTARPNRDGYKVTYPDGYISWSPKHTFEEAYREVSAGERKML